MKRHEFEMIAAALRESHPGAPDPDARDAYNDEHNGRLYQHRADCEAIADALARGTAPGGNRAFDRELFLRNAGVTEQ